MRVAEVKVVRGEPAGSGRIVDAEGERRRRRRAGVARGTNALGRKSSDGGSAVRNRRLCPSPRYAIGGLVVSIRSSGELRPDEKIVRDAPPAKLSPLPAACRLPDR